MKISNKKLAEAKVQKARRDLLKTRKELKEALICGPTGSFTKSTAHSAKIMGYTGLQEDVLKESVSEKSFDEVRVGDIGRDYADNEVVILAKGPASNFSYADGFEEFVDLSDYDSQDVAFNDQIDAEWPECVLVQFVEDGSEVVYSYGSDGVLVPQSRVRQISFDFIDNGVDEQDLISRIQDAMDVAGITIVGGPAFGDTSWSKAEYGLKELYKDKTFKRNPKRVVKESVSKELRRDVYDRLVDYLEEMGDSDYPFHKSVFRKAFNQWITENADEFEKICQSEDVQDIADELYSIFEKEGINSKCFDF